jgi:hypothetical protein
VPVWPSSMAVTALRRNPAINGCCGAGRAVPNAKLSNGEGSNPAVRAGAPLPRLWDGGAPCIVLERRRLRRRHVGTFHTSSCVWQPLRLVPYHEAVTSARRTHRVPSRQSRRPWCGVPRGLIHRTKPASSSLSLPYCGDAGVSNAPMALVFSMATHAPAAGPLNSVNRRRAP